MFSAKNVCKGNAFFWISQNSIELYLPHKIINLFLLFLCDIFCGYYYALIMIMLNVMV